MIAKYLIAGAISATLAGGAVWMAADAAELHPHDTVKVRKDNADTPAPRLKSDPAASNADDNTASTIQRLMGHAGSKPARRYDDADATTDMDAVADDDMDMSRSMTDWLGSERKDSITPKARKAADKEAGSSRKMWLDDYLGSRSDTDEDMDGPSESSAHMMSKAERRDASKTEDKSDAKRSASGMAKGKSGKDKSAKGMTADDRDANTNAGSARATGTFVIAPGSKARAGMKAAGGSAMAAPYAMLVDEAEKLEIEDVRDGAYLNIIDYALMQRDFDVAKTLVAELSTEELRDTARQNRGIALARAGMTEEAFAVVDELEVDELSDPIRLAIIQAATQTRVPMSSRR